MANSIAIGVTLRADNKGLSQGFRLSRDEIDKFKQATDKATKAKEQFRSEAARMNDSLLSLRSAALQVAGALGLAFSFKQSLDNTIRQEQAVAQLEATLRSTGQAAGLTSKELQQLASDLQGVTTYGDEATIEMQALLLTFTQIKGEVLSTVQNRHMMSSVNCLGG